MPLLIFISSFLNKKAYWKITSFDIICGLIALSGLILWWFTKVGNFAILMSIIADLAAAIPTVSKAFKFPETENSTAFLTAGIASLIGLLTIKVWNFETSAFALYIVSICTVLYSLIKFKLGKRLIGQSA